MGMLRIFTAALLLGTVACYRFYQDKIPNADIVPHPCKPNFFWRGLGHTNPLGGGPRNPFGQDFAKYHAWTKELCRMDSDGDGYYNGQELGDPNCIWTNGTFAEQRTGITHPGVCDPYGSPKCAGRDVSCETGEFICDGINDPDVFNITLRFPPTAVPAKETSYMCFTFEMDMLDPNVDYHLIATKPYIDNPNVMHHITLSGCDATSTALTEPKSCLMATPGCQNGIGLWTLGMPGECIYKDAGFKIGRKAGYHRLSMQHHWTNPQLKTDYVDSSGMVLYLTRKLRPYNAGYFSTGQTHLVIPPGMDRVMTTSTCTGRCTRKIMKGPIKLMTGLNHMHYLGYKQNVEHFRNDDKLRDLTPDEAYSYDNPVVHEYHPPQEVRPGDELKTTCIYKSNSRTTTAMFGEGTFDEMCFGIFTFYPAENLTLPFCTTWDDIHTCDIDLTTSKINGCNFGMLFNATHPTRNRLFSKVYEGCSAEIALETCSRVTMPSLRYDRRKPVILDNCNFYGGCRRECPAAIAEVRQNECLRGQMMGYFSDLLRIVAAEDHEVAKFLSGLHSCECPNPPEPTYPTSGAGSVSMGVLLLLASAILQMFM